MVYTSQYYTLTVDNSNDAPEISINNVATSEDVSVVVTFNITDVDSGTSFVTENLSFYSEDDTLVDSVFGYEFISTSSLMIIPSQNMNGSTTLTNTVTDGIDFGTQTFDISVEAVNDAPVISGVAPTTLTKIVNMNLSTVIDIDSDGFTFSIVYANLGDI